MTVAAHSPRGGPAGHREGACRPQHSQVDSLPSLTPKDGVQAPRSLPLGADLKTHCRKWLMWAPVLHGNCSCREGGGERGPLTWDHNLQRGWRWPLRACEAALHCGRCLGPPDKRDKHGRVPPDPRTPGQKPGAAAVENPLPLSTLCGAARLLPRGRNLSTVLSTRNMGRAGESADCSEIKSTVKRPSAWFQSWKPWWSWASQDKQCGCPGEVERQAPAPRGILAPHSGTHSTFRY